MSREIIISFDNKEQAEAFYNWFEEDKGEDEFNIYMNDAGFNKLNYKYQKPKSSKGYYQIKIGNNETN